MALKRDQIWQRDAALARIAELRTSPGDDGGVERWAASGAAVRAKHDAAASLENICRVAAWLLAGQDQTLVPWTTWQSVQAAYLETLARFRVQPVESRLACLYAPLAFGLAVRGQAAGADEGYVQALYALGRISGGDFLDKPTTLPHRRGTRLAATTDVAEGHAEEWENLRLSGFCFEVIAKAEGSGSKSLSLAEQWQWAAAAAQMTGDLARLVQLAPSLVGTPQGDERLTALFLWCAALPSLDWQRRYEQALGRKLSLVRDPPFAMLLSAARAGYRSRKEQAWLKTMAWLAASIQLPKTASFELTALNAAALARWCHRIHYTELRGLLLALFADRCLARTADAVIDLFAVADDLLPEPDKPAAKVPAHDGEGIDRLRLAARWQRRSATGSLAWRTLAAIGRRRLRELVRSKAVAERLSQAETVAVADLVVAELGRLKGPLMKIGQTASYFGLDLPAAALSSLASLREHAQPLPFATVEAVLKEELGPNIWTTFASIAPTPLGVGSIGQVHRARLASGEEVAVKVQVPGMPATIVADIANLRVMAILGKWLLPTTNIRAHIDELEAQLLAECDFRREARMQERFRAKFAARSDIVIPRTFPELCTKRVLVMSFEAGQTLEEFRAHAKPEERDLAGKALLRFVATSCRDGLFQSDNHPGNYRFRPGGTLCCFDFGSVKEWTPQATALWAEMMRAGHERNFARFRRAAIAMGRQRNVKEALHRRLYDVFVNHSMRLIGEPGAAAFEHQVLHQEIISFFSPLSSEIWNTGPDPQFIFGFRVYIGLIALMSELGAHGDWYQVIKDIMYEGDAGLSKSLSI